MGRAARDGAIVVFHLVDGEPRVFNDRSRSLVALDQDSALIAVIEMSQSRWLVGGLVPGLAREPQKKLSSDAPALLALLDRVLRQQIFRIMAGLRRQLAW